MAAWFCPTLSADAQAAVLADRDEHPDPVVRRKMLVLWAVHLGHTRQQAADLAAVGVATAKRYLIAYRDGGLDALRTRDPGPRPASRLADHADAIARALTEQPARTVAEAAERIERLTGIRRQPSQTRKFLKGPGLKFQRVRAVPGPPKKVSRST